MRQHQPKKPQLIVQNVCRIQLVYSMQPRTSNTKKNHQYLREYQRMKINDQISHYIQLFFIIILLLMIQIRKKSIQITTLKNKIKTKHNIKVSENATYQKLLAKIKKSFTSKPFTLQIRSKDGLSYKVLTKELWSHFIKNFSGQQINIVNNQLSILQEKSKLQQEKSNSNNSQELYIEPLKKQHIIGEVFQQITMYLKQFAQKKIKDKLNTQKGRESKDNLKCSQCKQTIVKLYYKCLICKECILCENCEQKESQDQLVNHKYRSHPFAKIRPQTSQLDQNMKITTLKPNSIKLDQTDISDSPIEKEEINKMLKQTIKAIYHNIYEQNLD